jgi:meso-butanediol dehydrogenase / (S,S)-butanediol dehydrogenase / diacetyl reductase
VSVEAQANSAVAEVIAKFGHIDHLVNNAGVAVFKPLLEHSAAAAGDGREPHGPPFLCTQACAPHLLRNACFIGAAHRVHKEKASIVNIASISGLRASSLRVAYGTSKAALIHLTKQQALELGNAGIRVNAVAPGPVETAIAKAVHSHEIRRDYRDTIPLARYGSEAEIACAVLWLLSPQASYVNGQCLAVDGGFDASGIGLVSLRNTAE